MNDLTPIKGIFVLFYDFSVKMLTGGWVQASNLWPILIYLSSNPHRQRKEKVVPDNLLGVFFLKLWQRSANNRAIVVSFRFLPCWISKFKFLHAQTETRLVLGYNRTGCPRLFLMYPFLENGGSGQELSNTTFLRLFGGNFGYYFWARACKNPFHSLPSTRHTLLNKRLCDKTLDNPERQRERKLILLTFDCVLSKLLIALISQWEGKLRYLKQTIR